MVLVHAVVILRVQTAELITLLDSYGSQEGLKSQPETLPLSPLGAILEGLFPIYLLCSGYTQWYSVAQHHLQENSAHELDTQGPYPASRQTVFRESQATTGSPVICRSNT